jgi:hypothetical protein
MEKRSAFLRLLLGNKTFELQNVYKRAVLRGQLSVLSAFVGILYTFIDLANKLYVNIPFYAALIIVSSMVLILNRIGKYLIANMVYLTSIVVLVFFFAINDVNHTGVHTYFIVFAIIALILCGYENLKVGILFCLMAIALFFVAYWVNPPGVIPQTVYSEKYVSIAFAGPPSLKIMD